jgi:site-specific DNA recombinase
VSDCVIYARVSTKEQQDEGYSIPAQLKAIRAFCEREGLSPVAEFVEAESAGRAGRKQFSAMCDFLEANPEVRVVVAHKLDRLYRNFRDAITLEEDLGIKPRYVLSDIPDTPQGELLRDVNLSVAKYYLSNLREEVKKGMEEKVAQGGWPHRAPLGYLNDKATRTLVVDPVTAPLVRHAFERYASGLVSISDLAEELEALGLRSISGNKLRVSVLDRMLKNPLYAGLLRYKGELYSGSHEPLITRHLFDQVQDAFLPNRRGNSREKRSYVLRDFLYCSECGAKITAGTHKGHVYYRCTHGKGDCSQHSYIREELLLDEVASVLERIAIDPEIAAALLEEARIREAQTHDAASSDQDALRDAVASVKRREAALLDSLLDGVVSREAYASKSSDLERERLALERRLADLSQVPAELSAQVEAILETAMTAYVHFEDADEDLRRRILSEVVCNLEVEDSHIASYQYKGPFGVLQKDSNGALLHSWWAILDLNQ